MNARHLGSGLLLLLAAAAAQAQKAPTELRGASDHPLVSRYAGAVLQDAAQEGFAAVAVPASPRGPDQAAAVEGRVNAYFYIAPKERSALEVFRNYQAALAQAGFTTLYTCEMAACDKAGIKDRFASSVVAPRKWQAKGIPPAGSIDRDVRFASARLSRNGQDSYVLLFVAEPNSIWGAPAVVQLVVEPAAMEGGKVVVNTDALRKALGAEGRIALYGIYFDTGKSVLKPESRPQLAEMAKLLQAQPALKVHIVGHTDNQGTVAGNLALSQQRADAIVGALVQEHHIDAKRLSARGLASFAPVASNGSEAGRARNRRVELVEQ
ncbi:MAG: OmpA family protein [Roseateles sp.]|uniref:OmpA family protein n=1 Tax=Roseateles sp. TaxID=1971397 RepID=UPI0039E7530C